MTKSLQFLNYKWMYEYSDVSTIRIEMSCMFGETLFGLKTKSNITKFTCDLIIHNWVILEFIVIK